MLKPYYKITRACAKKDWGAVIYDFALMSHYPEPISPSNIIMPKAINIWKYYYELRPDVKKEAILPTDKEYYKFYKNYSDDVEKVDENLKYLNCCYFLEKSNIYNELIENGKNLLIKYNKKAIDISRKGFKEFENVYEH